MSLLFFTSVVLTLLVSLLISPAGADANAPKGYVMPWACLQRCGYSAAQVEEHMAMLIRHKQLFSRVAVERFNLGPNGTLVDNNSTVLLRVAPQLERAGIRAVLMCDSFPYPRDLILWMRAVWREPIPFLADLGRRLENEGAFGVNFDWEPSTPIVPITAKDAADYAAFLGTATTFLWQKHKKTVSVDVATWQPVWNFTAIAGAMHAAATGAGIPRDSWPQIMTMSTYTYHNSIFVKELDYAVEKIGVVSLDLLAPGLETFPEQLQDGRIKFRFDALKEKKLCRSAIWKIGGDSWKSTNGSMWFDEIADYLKNC